MVTDAEGRVLETVNLWGYQPLAVIHGSVFGAENAPVFRSLARKGLLLPISGDRYVVTRKTYAALVAWKRSK